MKTPNILKLFVLCPVVFCLLLFLFGCDSPRMTTVLSTSSTSLQLTVEAQTDSAKITRLGWDTEGTGRDTINLLKSPVELSISKNNKVLTPQVTSKMFDKQTIKYTFKFQDNKQLTWEIAIKEVELSMQIMTDDDLANELDKL